jgi:hypothetical protein
MTMDPIEPLHASLGPAPFVFHPEAPDRLVSAFSRSFKALAWAMLLGLGGWMATHQENWHTQAAGWGALAWLLMAATVWAVGRSQTRLNTQELFQSWLWDKKMLVRELAYAKLIRVPGVDWLIAPRLYVRNLSGKFTVIYCADPAVLKDMRRLCQELDAFRKRS